MKPLTFRRQLLLVGGAGFISGLVGSYSLRAFTLPLPVWMMVCGIIGGLALSSVWFFSSKRLSRVTGSDLEETRGAATWPFTAFALLPIQYIPFSVIQTTTSEGVLRPLDPAWQVTITLLFSAGLVFALLIYKFPVLNRGPLKSISRHPVRTLVLIMVLWLAAASTMDILKTYYMNKVGAYNTAIFTDMMRNSFSENGILYTKMILADGSSVLGIHSSFIWLLVVPVFEIWPSYQWLLVISNFALVLSAVPIYMISRKFFSGGISLLIVALFLMNRLIIAQPGIGDQSEERFLPVLFLTAFYFWQTKNFLPYLAFAFLCLTVREDMGLVLIIWGLLSLIQRRGLKWVIAPALLGGGWLFVMAKWIIPSFNPTGKPLDRTVRLYGNLGNSPREIILNLIKPWVLFRVPFSSMRHIAVWYVLFQSFSYGAPLLAAPVLMAAVPFAELIFLEIPGINVFNMIPIAAMVMPAMILGLNNADRLAGIRWKIRISTVLVLLSLFSTAALSYTWFNPDLYKPRYNYEAAVEVLDQMPEGSTAMLPDFMAAKAKSSQAVRGYYQVMYEIETYGNLTLQEDYIVLDLNMPARFSDDNVHEGLTNLKEAVEASKDYEITFDSNDLRVYKRHATI